MGDIIDSESLSAGAGRRSFASDVYKDFGASG